MMNRYTITALRVYGDHERCENRVTDEFHVFCCVRRENRDVAARLSCHWTGGHEPGIKTSFVLQLVQ